MTAPISSARELRTRLAQLPPSGSFLEAELEELPDPVRRYFEAAIAIATPPATAARFRMVGTIKLGRRWVPFRARQIEAPHHGFVGQRTPASSLVPTDTHEGRGR